MSRKRILVLTPRFPYPVVGGDRLRIHALCRELAQEHDLTLLSLCESEEEAHMAVPEDEVFSQVERVLLPKWQSRLQVLAAMPGRTPLQVAYYRSRRYARRIAYHLPRHDACLAHLIRTGDYVRSQHVPTALEMTDAISMNYQRVRQLPATRGIRSWIYRIEAQRLMRYEKLVVREFPLVSLVSEIDRDFLLEGSAGSNVLVCSNGVDLQSLPFKNRTQSAPVGVFIGNMQSLQNMDACMYFAEEVLPLIRSQIDFRFRVVGRISSADARRLRAFDGVEVAENVASVADAVSDARVGLAPVRLGAGVQNKVLEYMALGLPVVTSTVALEGLQARPSIDVLVADSPHDYLTQLQTLWQSLNLREQFAARGRQYVQSHHSWSARLAPFVESMNRMMSA